MSNVLKVSTPVAGYENSTRTNAINIKDPKINNVINVEKITRPDGKTADGDYQKNDFVLLEKSNFESFLKIIKNSPSVTDLVSDLMFVKFQSIVNSGINENFAEEISEFLKMIQTTPENLEEMLKGQVEASGKFSGPFFELLRKAFANAPTQDIQLKVLDLLKRYNDFSAGKHILEVIRANIQNIADRMPQRFRDGLLEMAGNLDFNEKNGDILKNLQILKKEIVPFLSNYVKNSNDFGRTRDLITSLVLNIARYENGNGEVLKATFEELLNFSSIKEQFGGGDTAKLTEILFALEGKAVANANVHKMNEQLISIISKGIQGAAGYENVEVFKDIMSAILINKSVYMPFTHIMLPLDINGTLMFSEIWIDPNDHPAGGAEKETATKFLIKFDIKDVGFFDLVILHTHGKIDMQIFCPEKFADMEKIIKPALSSILESNGLKVNNLYVDKSQGPLSISEVFPKVYERRDSINVRI